MEKIKEVKKILIDMNESQKEIGGIVSKGYINRKAKEICQLFEPKADESRFLTEVDLPWLYNFTAVRGNVDTILEMQRDLTASTKEAECQERVERIFKEIERLWQDCDYICHIPLESWQALKKREGVNA